jgi:6-phosphogluconolactonase
MTKLLRFLSFVILVVDATHAPAKNFRAYIGTYSTHGSEGIYVCDFDPATGAIENKRVAAPFKSNDGEEFKNASFLALHPNGKYLYSVSEGDDFRGTNGGGVIGFAIDAATGQLKQTSAASSGGAGPCHLSMNDDGRFVLAANYAGGSVAQLDVGDDGKLVTKDNRPRVFIQHPMCQKGRPRVETSARNPERQEAPHAHQIVLDAKNRFALVCDLGLDEIFAYRFDAGDGGLQTSKPRVFDMAPGAGPRHLAFHPNGKFAYVINELDSTVAAYRYDDGTLQELQTISTLPKDSHVENTCAEIAVHPSGKFLYASNRGHDSIAMFSIDSASGKLAPLGHHPTGGRTPRHFTLDPTGAYLLAANQDSDSITVHRIDQSTGRLERTEHTLKVPSPACILIAHTK